VFPHLIDRQKPGIIAVNAGGRRFTNEAASYHDFVAALLTSTPPGQEPFAWLVADRRAIRRYGLGFAKPFPLPLGPVLRSGYLRSGRSVAELASAIGVDPAVLGDTIARFNDDAALGRDGAFGRGGTLYNRFMGDPTHRPNPNLAPLETAPFYAVRVVVGDLGTFAGLWTDGSARVLDGNGAPVPGLYAVGNDMASALGGAYPGGGATLGPAMTFAYVAARDMAGAEG
jgi:succinate dehydrogenase/fumarate reductase flavoprotein subunit